MLGRTGRGHRTSGGLHLNRAGGMWGGRRIPRQVGTSPALSAAMPKGERRAGRYTRRRGEAEKFRKKHGADLPGGTIGQEPARHGSAGLCCRTCPPWPTPVRLRPANHGQGRMFPMSGKNQGRTAMKKGRSRRTDHRMRKFGRKGDARRVRHPMMPENPEFREGASREADGGGNSQQVRRRSSRAPRAPAFPWPLSRPSSRCRRQKALSRQQYEKSHFFPLMSCNSSLNHEKYFTIYFFTIFLSS